MGVAYARHGTACGNDVTEMVEQVEHLLGTERMGVFRLYARYLIGYALMHILRTSFINMSETVFHGIFVHPHPCVELIAVEIVQGSGISLLVGIGWLVFHAPKCFQMVTTMFCKTTKDLRESEDLTHDFKRKLFPLG